MNMPKLLTIVGMICVLVAGATQQVRADDVEKTAAMGASSLARLEYSLDNGLTPPQKRGGQAVCIDDSAGRLTFITFDMNQSLPPGELTSFTLTPAGQVGNGVEATFIGSDPRTGLSFIAVTGAKAHKWKALKFERTSGLKLGQELCSVGLLTPDMGNASYMGLARLGAKLRLPDKAYYVSGGDLAVMSSPVMTLDGRVVGLVGGQRPMRVEMQTPRGPVITRMIGRQATRFFIPVEKFSDSIQRIPTGAKDIKPLSWFGVFQFRDLPSSEAAMYKLKDAPGVIVKQVLPGGPADKKGVRPDDVVLAVNGKPLEKLPTPTLTRLNFQRKMLALPAGETVSLTILRDNKRRDVQLTTEALPVQMHLAKRHYNKKFGFAARDLVVYDRYADESEPLKAEGVVVLYMLRSSPLDAPLRAIDVQPPVLITQVDGRRVPDVDTLAKVLADVLAGGKKEVDFVVLEDRKPKVVPVKVPVENKKP